MTQPTHHLDPGDPPAPGTVTLVGAGPGDPDLLTLKAARVIAAATLLLVDDLVNDAVLAYANPQARVVRVGKRGGCKSTPQSFIHRLMVRAARRGETVVRLKGGDPFVFGRGGEECEVLRAAGIPVRCVNGITSGLAAATELGIAATHRQLAHGVMLLTGHRQAGEPPLDWAALGACARQAGLTMIIYMGVAQAAHIQHELLRAMPGSTPVAIAQHATLPQRRHAVTTLERLVSTLQNSRLGSPAVIIVGDVVRAAAVLAMDDPSTVLPRRA
ncbi:uroporphyrin-III C-methyltransferase [Tepidimonas ignava]|uniref:uroporphyrinogen-III C-methyltransferase n=1 Tax=Tepidimonas ignava TaxID=114249 RepID=A0A4R3LMN5_9BURK|nr:uroporphyrinogen-III C-methyltransferase [Tepidimonas ignava]TCS99844.1 uroporphyrin-III C-methyltransferase [Tepidimonas ignava]TSE23229.1 Uroporphyrinogen-III C-methyltransferase [Tepidimonas ignava]